MAGLSSLQPRFELSPPMKSCRSLPSRWTALALCLPLLLWSPTLADDVFRLGIIGLDTSHSIAFAKLFNDDATGEIGKCRVVIAYPHGSPDIESSTSRIPAYTEAISSMGIKIAESVEEVVANCDGVLLETNDGRPHLEQVRPVIAAGKPVFIDKPIAGSLADAVAIFREAQEAKVPVFSSSSLRYMESAQAARSGEIGRVLGCDAYSPCHLEATHPDLFWYGIHGVEILFTAMGPGCESVVRVKSADTDVVVGRWSDGRIGTFRGIRNGKSGYGGTAFGSKAVQPLGPYGGYKPLVEEIAKFFLSGKAPVAPEETLQIYAFMQAADLSHERGGVPVSIQEVMQHAEDQAGKKSP